MPWETRRPPPPLRAAKDPLLGSPTVSPARPGTRGNLPPAARAAPLLRRGRVTGNRGQRGSAAPTRAAPPRGARRACGRRPRRAPDTRGRAEPSRPRSVCVRGGAGERGQPLPSGRRCPGSPARSGPAPGEARGAPLPLAPTGTPLHPPKQTQSLCPAAAAAAGRAEYAFSRRPRCADGNTIGIKSALANAVKPVGYLGKATRQTHAQAPVRPVSTAHEPAEEPARNRFPRSAIAVVRLLIPTEIKAGPSLAERYRDRFRGHSR
ncbi:collagen alpha-1(I) chain-like [Aquila chrysaetos chrysaetos]|uniref:collagen alpha-1(I) chain-like n=1 Tax=Aquila chrysaetos chrysaetos TaxID=223781 RepID=UPI0011772300|nr:collagen alpha-1(I) chain-like [Aquila chrysaetos chrysaetos]